MSSITTYSQQFEQTMNEILALSKQLSEEQIRWKPSEEKWSIIEVLGHVEEANRYWLEDLLHVIANPGSAWGRTMQHEGRLQAIAAVHEQATADVLQKIEQFIPTFKEAFSKLTEADLQVEAPHRNPKFGTKPMSFLVEHFIVEHMQAHLQQIKRNVDAFNNQ